MIDVIFINATENPTDTTQSVTIDAPNIPDAKTMFFSMYSPTLYTIIGYRLL